MPPRNALPAYRHFKPRNRAVVTLGGHDFYLGKFNSPESHNEYDRLVAEYLAAGRTIARQTGPQVASVAVLVNAVRKSNELSCNHEHDYVAIYRLLVRLMAVRPDRDQHRHLSPTQGKIHLDVTKITFHPAAGRMIQQQMRLTLTLATAAHITTDLVVSAAITVLIPHTLEDPLRRVPLLLRGRGVTFKDLVDHRRERPDLGALHWLRSRIAPRLRLDQRLFDRITAVTQPPGDLANAHSVTMQ